MERSRLRARTDLRYALLNPILEELSREGKIKMTAGKPGELISLVELRGKSQWLGAIGMLSAYGDS